VDSKLNGGLASLPTIAVQKVSIARLSNENDLISCGLSEFPSLSKGGSKHRSLNGSASIGSGASNRSDRSVGNQNAIKNCDRENKTNQIENSQSSESISTLAESRDRDRSERDRDSLFVNKSRLDPLGMKLPLSPNGKLQILTSILTLGQYFPIECLY
jgi:hypothetical protein